MEQRIFHGNITPDDIARALVAKFNRGNLRSQQVGREDKVIVQIATRSEMNLGGDTALSVTLQKAEDGVIVQIGKQAWLGVAASLGATALSAIKNPFNLIGRLDDLAQDIGNLSLSNQVWTAIEETVSAAGASFEISERLRRTVCDYCNTPNPLGESSCIACGAPLGDIQPRTCLKCGFVIKTDEAICPNCKSALFR